MRARLMATLLAAGCLWLWTAAAFAAAGTVVGISGACTAGGRVLKLGDPVEVSETLNVPAGGKLKLRMADGSVVSVAPGSQLTVAAYAVGPSGQRADAKFSLSQGLIRAAVAGQPAAFEVTTAVGTASVRGTDWFIAALPGSAQVGVLAGLVDLRSAATGRAVEIPAGWGARLEAGRDPVQPRVWSQSEFNDFIARTQ
ncbi:MAG TPA: FecR family protein [Stellaceae bacterium]|nr:FecR family protein [Stellaceae bacterium]